MMLTGVVLGAGIVLALGPPIQLSASGVYVAPSGSPSDGAAGSYSRSIRRAGGSDSRAVGE
jgi:hypothetical protein